MKKFFTLLFISLILSSASICKADYEAEKKSPMFYQHLLEQFCRMYYHDCFNRQYFNNSLIVKKISVTSGNFKGENIVSWNMLVEGIHSFKKTQTFNDDSFEAFVDDRGNNVYEVTFVVKKHYLIGNEKEMSATRVMTYSE